MLGKAQPADLFAGMNRMEMAFALGLEVQKRAGDIHAWWYEEWTFKLGADTRYTPDFMVLHKDRTLEAVEVKGFMRDDARVKLKVFAQRFPLRVTLVTKDGTTDCTAARTEV